MVMRKTKKNKKKKTENIWYNGVKGLKKAGVDVSSYMTSEREEEISKCMNDAFYFIENYCFIRTLDPDEKGNRVMSVKDAGGLRWYQNKQIQDYLDNRFIALNFPRQSGKTVGTVLYFVWKLMFTDDFNIMCLANKDKVAKNILTEVKRILKNLPVWMSEGIVLANEHKIGFENGSWIEASATTLDAGRSSSANIIYLDEVAFVKRNVWLEFYKGVYPTISSGNTTQLIATSTPNGLNHWWKIISEGRQKLNDYVIHEIKWYDVPGRDEKFKEQTIKNLGKAAWDSEYDCQFIGSAGTLLNSTVLQSLVSSNPLKEISIYNNKWKLKIYKEYIKGHQYIMTHDPSYGYGDGSDYSGIHVWDVTYKNKIEQVAVMYENTIGKEEAPYVLKKIGELYGNPFEISEVNKCEDVPKDLITEAEYMGEVYRDPKRYGLLQTGKTRSEGLKQLQKMFNNDMMMIHDFDTIHELSVFIKKGDKYQADDDEHDDLVMSMNLMTWLMSDKNRYEKYITDQVDYMNDIQGIKVNNGIALVVDGNRDEDWSSDSSDITDCYGDDIPDNFYPSS